MTPEFKKTINALKERIDKRKALAASLADKASVRLFGLNGKFALAGPDLEKSHVSRLTFFDDLGPSGHIEFSDLTDAIYEALAMGYSPDSPK